MKIPLKIIRNFVLAVAIMSIIIMDMILLIAHIKLTQDSGMSVGIGFLQLGLLIISVPLIMMFCLLDPGWRWWLVMGGAAIALILLLFR